MGKMYEQNIANEARTIATMLDWSNNKNDSTFAKLTKLLRDLAMVIEDQMSAMRHCVTFPYKVEMWQYTDSGRVPGIQGNVDINLLFTEE